VAEWERVTDPQHEVETITETKLASPWNVIVHNDPVTLMSYVTMVLQRLFGYGYQKAHTLMMQVHNEGRAIVWTGAREQAEIYLHKLHAAQLLATMETTGE
jgi:ATP-dependent Clp protease adaptor protein ClpS